MNKVSVGVIGGTGLYEMEGITEVETLDMETPFGKPSDSIKVVKIGEKEVVFLPRHGLGHRLLPTEIPVKANIWALKKIGVERVLSVSAVGSLKEKIKPRDIVIPEQIIDRTKSRPISFFGEGVVGHITFAEPFCTELSNFLFQAVSSCGYKAHRHEIYICMEGPQFSTKAESNLYRSWGGGVIGMTALPEAKLAREAEICYTMLALPTDYDCWKEDVKAVSVENIVENLNANTRTAQEIIKKLVDILPPTRECKCGEAARYAILTDKKLIPQNTRKKIELFYGKYWKE